MLWVAGGWVVVEIDVGGWVGGWRDVPSDDVLGELAGETRRRPQCLD